MGAGCYHTRKKVEKTKNIVKAHSKVYAAVTPEEVFQASEQIFNLADEGDLDMVQDTRRLKVSRAVSDREMPSLQGSMGNSGNSGKWLHPSRRLGRLKGETWSQGLPQKS